MNLPRPILLRIVRTAVGVWFACRVMLVLVAVPVLFREGVPVFVLVVAFLTWADMVRNREWILFANLGVSRAWVLGIAALVATGIEVVFGPELGRLFLAAAALVPGAQV